jgi:hypothetical protein
VRTTEHWQSRTVEHTRQQFGQKSQIKIQFGEKSGIFERKSGENGK